MLLYVIPGISENNAEIRVPLPPAIIIVFNILYTSLDLLMPCQYNMCDAYTRGLYSSYPYCSLFPQEGYFPYMPQVYRDTPVS